MLAKLEFKCLRVMSKKIYILIIDDNQSSLFLVRSMLEDEGYNTLTANSGELALASLEDNIPDLILLDIMMPRMDGFEVCKHIKQKENLVEIPLIFLTALTKVDDKLKGFQLGAVDYISKPFQKEELIARIKTHLALRENEIELRKKNKELVLVKEKAIENEKRFKQLFNNLGDAVYVVRFGGENRGRILEVNPEATRQTGYTRSELLQMNIIKDLFIPGSEEISTDKWEEKLRKGETVTTLEMKRKKDGTEYWTEVTVTPIEFKGKEASLSINHDFTERKKAEEELLKHRNNLEELVKKRTVELNFTNAKLEKAAGMKDEFLANMSHELRTPLNAILGLSEALQEKIYGNLNPKQTEKIQHIDESGRHLLGLINEILDLSKVEAGKIGLEYVEISIEELSQSSLRFIKQIAFKKKIKVSSSISSTIEIFRADEKRMKQILVNLLSNAVKFTPDGEQIGLDVNVNEKTQTISFIVWDTGIGISKQNLDKLFQPFVQIDSVLSRQYEGTGLGLALVNNLTNLHNGSITVDSKEGKGSRFNVTIPLMENGYKGTIPIIIGSPRDEDESKINMNEPDVLIAKKNVQAKKENQKLILIAEDNKPHLTTIKDYLEAKQFRVAVARNGKEAVEKAHEIIPALVLMDIQMPKMDGLEAIKEIRASSNADVSGIPIIAVTALAMPGDREKCINAGANNYLKKPVGLKFLVKTINDLLENKG